MFNFVKSLKTKKKGKITMKKKIDFKELQDLVANIDYIFNDCYPVVFSVDGKEFACGITSSFEEDQYLIEIPKNSRRYSIEHMLPQQYNLLDLQDPDWMEYNRIGRMLKRKCSITDDSVITLDTTKSFSGSQLFCPHMEEKELSIKIQLTATVESNHEDGVSLEEKLENFKERFIKYIDDFDCYADVDINCSEEVIRDIDYDIDDDEEDEDDD